jgi:hypothetical protein
MNKFLEYVLPSALGAVVGATVGVQFGFYPLWAALLGAVASFLFSGWSGIKKCVLEEIRKAKTEGWISESQKKYFEGTFSRSIYFYLLVQSFVFYECFLFYILKTPLYEALLTSLLLSSFLSLLVIFLPILTPGPGKSENKKLLKKSLLISIPVLPFYLVYLFFVGIALLYKNREEVGKDFLRIGKVLLGAAVSVYSHLVAACTLNGAIGAYVGTLYGQPIFGLLTGAALGSLSHWFALKKVKSNI